MALRDRHPPGSPIAPQPPPIDVLVVDDSAVVRQRLKAIIESDPHFSVTLAADPYEAVAILSKSVPGVIVLDVEMPRMDGFSLTEAIRDSRRFRDLPVILVTALESDADKARGLAAGADAYCVKSAFDQKDLLALIFEQAMGAQRNALRGLGG